MPNPPLRVGVIGAGYIGRTHLAAYARLPEARVVAVVDASPERAAATAPSGAKPYTALEQLLAEETLDALDICLPTALHERAVLAGVRAGLDILVEKPFALNLAAVDRMLEAAEKNGRRIMVAHVCRFMPEYMLAKEIVERGDFGRPLFFGAWRHSATPDWSWQNWLHDRKRSGGTLMDLQIHDIDLANWLLGRPQEFSCHEATRPGLEGPSHVVSRLIHADGALSAIEAGHLMPAAYPFTTGYRLVLERGTVEAGAGFAEERSVRITSAEGARIIPVTQLPGYESGDPYLEEIRHFVNCLLTGQAFRISAEEARLAVETVRKLAASRRPNQAKSGARRAKA